MRGLLVPPRRRGFEYLEEPGVDPSLVRRSLADVARANRLFGGTRAVLKEIDAVLRCDDGAGTGAGSGARAENGDRTGARAATGAGNGVRTLTLLDVGTGAADIPARAQRLAAERGVVLTTIGLDESETLSLASRERLTASMRADALAIPCATGSVDIVTCSQVLHHFPDDLALQVIRELDRVARVRVIISDLRRSWLAAAGIWVSSFPLGFHPVSRHDGVVSVMRGYVPGELAGLVTTAIGRAPSVSRRLGFRVTAAWTPRKQGATQRAASARVEA